MINSGGRLEFKPVPDSEFELKADLVLLAMGFLGPETNGMLGELGVKMTDRGNVWRDEHWMTSVPGVFTAGDMQRGQSLIVWAIAEGRSCARGVDQYRWDDPTCRRLSASSEWRPGDAYYHQQLPSSAARRRLCTPVRGMTHGWAGTSIAAAGASACAGTMASP